MARPSLYTARRTTRLAPATDSALIKRAAAMELLPAVVIRLMVEKCLEMPLEALADNKAGGGASLNERQLHRATLPDEPQHDGNREVKTGRRRV